ncbi:MAG: pantoate--beta-alanine ligase [Deltaproteobacteria bacterium]|nr:pantoate--beta-alanine ligase [Deltaproteobacteria bacterium]MBN2670210.1 pantoate--beta-alanine ligase [Deltaproteobacteria bacterium]
MKTIHNIKEMQQYCRDQRQSGKRIGFVPTMGALHEGHLRLVDEAKKHSDVVVVSIFVNPTQFGPNEDFEKYPRDLEADAAKLAPRGADVVFNPNASDMYPEDCLSTIHVRTITADLCGAHRPGHFDGVALVVTKLFNIVGECTAVFGRKDFQQLQVIKRFTADLNIPVQIIGMPTVREADGLAMSSRNSYLSPDERKRALAIARALTEAHELFTKRSPLATIEQYITEAVMQSFDTIDYVTVVHPETLQPLDGDASYPQTVLVAVAAKIGSTRLIDNTVLGEDAPPINK